MVVVNNCMSCFVGAGGCCDQLCALFNWRRHDGCDIVVVFGGDGCDIVVVFSCIMHFSLLTATKKSVIM